jgi:hypothetical protein
LSWRDEIDTALQAWITWLEADQGRGGWRCVATAHPADEPGVFTIDLRGSDLTTDQADDLVLAGPDVRSVHDGHSVMEAKVEGEALRVRVAEFAPAVDCYVWRLRQQPTFLITALREGLDKLTDARLADRLARGELGGRLGEVTAPPFLPAQVDAYRACMGAGLWLVWGPPGTGKTKVLQEAISDLIASGKRVLLASSTNIAVDNALVGVVRARRHQPGDVVRVGPPQLSEIADNPQVCLPLIVKARLAEEEAERLRVSSTLLEMNRRAERLRDLQTKLAAFDVAAYEAAVALLAEPGRSAGETAAALVECELTVTQGLQAMEAARTAVDQSAHLAALATPDRKLWAEIEGKESRLAEVEAAAVEAEARALVAANTYAAAQTEITALSPPGGRVRWRDRKAMSTALHRLDAVGPERARLDDAALKARRIANSFRSQVQTQIADLVARATLGRNEVMDRDDEFVLAKSHLGDLEKAQFANQHRLAELQVAKATALGAEQLLATCQEHGWPTMHADAVALGVQVTQDNRSRSELEERHGKLYDEQKHRASAEEAKIIASARLVATTLARFRTNNAVLKGPYDIVLIDEVGAATLPEVLLAVAKASQCAVLFGDFMQLGPVIPPALEKNDRPDIRRWLKTDAFRHCGIKTPAEALEHLSCLVLDTQHRFGPHIMQLANLLAYDGLLKPGSGVRSPSEDDPEIVLIDTDGLGELAAVHRVSPNAGWWSAGLLLARAIIELHADTGESAGVVTPYNAQALATLEALRDVESSGRLLAEVGTAHRFQGREFPIVILDTVEPEHNGNLWIGQASRLPGSSSWQQGGVRLFNVATTRAQHRLYVIASRHRVDRAKPRSAFESLSVLLNERKARSIPASSLIAPLGLDAPDLGPEGKKLAEVLARHVEIMDIHDEYSFYDQFASLISQARQSVWLWSAWVASRVYGVLPVLRDAVDRGVRVTIFVRDPSDNLQQKHHFAKALADLRAVVPNVVEVNVAHEKVVVIDDQIVMLGSLNTLSQRRSREVMITMRGRHWAHRLLGHLHAEEFSRPPRCGACNRETVDLRRRPNAGSWYWHCYSQTCPAHGKGKDRAWTRDIIFRRPDYWLSGRSSG